MTIGNTQQFTSSATGGLIPYTYQWYYANDTAISGATSSTLVYKANFTGTYNIYLNVTDALNYRVKSNISNPHRILPTFSNDYPNFKQHDQLETHNNLLPAQREDSYLTLINGTMRMIPQYRVRQAQL